MCGITGLVNTQGIDISPSLLKVMTQAIEHRGPDGEGNWANKNVGLGHRRLSILDLSDNAKQPMASSDGSLILSYNGEIYNFQELRSELQQFGYKFSSSSDTEVLLYAFHKWGVNSFLKLNGMFALCIYDKSANKLFLARDRYGVKPLYYSHEGNLFRFASEHKAILASQPSMPKLDLDGIYEYFTFQNIISDKTFFQGIYMFPSGSYGELNLNSKKPMLNIHSYWDYQFKEPNHVDANELEPELKRLFEQAVRRQLVSDVEIGSYLSGGIDSGSITAIASKETSNLKTFTCGFDLSNVSNLEKKFDETKRAKLASSFLGTNHFETRIYPNDIEECLSKIVYHLEEPRVAHSYPNFYAASLSSSHLKVVMSGAGGDELFAGYPWRYYPVLDLSNKKEFLDRHFLSWNRLLEPMQLKKLFAPLKIDLDRPRNVYNEYFGNLEDSGLTPEIIANECLAFEAKTFLQGLFVMEDKISMAHGLETRVPFMDNDLVNFAMECPIHLKLGEFNSFKANLIKSISQVNQVNTEYLDGKMILRKMLAEYVPEEIQNAPKQGFASPDASWFRNQSSDFVLNHINDNKKLLNSIIDTGIIDEIITDHMSGKNNSRALIWSFLYLGEFLKQFSLSEYSS
ncbi:asparagine synthase (glutamine-hydrolyzing) [Gammaproteobacteria bacterium]|nr:asparagine synthase (glutamine-hydrolyzing) [Gammaproteobacteria bacterium]